MVSIKGCKSWHCLAWPAGHPAKMCPNLNFETETKMLCIAVSSSESVGLGLISAIFAVESLIVCCDTAFGLSLEISVL